MAKKVRCISPHGGCHNGMLHNGDPVQHVWDGGDQAKGIEGSWKLPDVPPEKLRLPPNPGGYVADSRLGHCAVGQIYDVDDEFYADGFHWEDITPDTGADKKPPDSKSPQVSGTPQPEISADTKPAEGA